MISTSIPFVSWSGCATKGRYQTSGYQLNFPDDNDPLVLVQLSTTQSFGGNVEYIGFSAAHRGSGTQVGTFKAHNYKMTCKGYGPSNAESQIDAGFYRIGF